MQKVSIEIETVNDMFDMDPSEAVAHILETLRDRFREYSYNPKGMPTKILDDCGNYIGDISFE